MAGDLMVEFDAAFLPAYSADIVGVVLDTTFALPDAERATAASRGSRSQRSFSQTNRLLLMFDPGPTPDQQQSRSGNARRIGPRW